MPNPHRSDAVAESSTYPVLEKPIFHDNIPGHLLVGIDDRSRYIIQQLGMIAQQNEWLIKAAIDTNSQVRHTNGRVISLEKWKEPLEEKNILSKIITMDKIFNFWTVFTALVLGIGSIAGGVVAVLQYFHFI